MTTEVATTQPAEAAAYDEALAAEQLAKLFHADGTPIGMEDVIDDQLGIPRLSILQQTAKITELGLDNSVLGHLYLNVTKETAKTLDAIVMGIVKQRSWMPEYDSAKKEDVEPICRSTNYMNPDRKYVESGAAPCATCAECPKSQWDRDRDLPPECAEIKNLLGVTRDGVPFVFGAKKTAMTPVNDYQKAFVYRRKPFLSVWTRISVKAVDNYFIPQFLALGEKVPLDQQVDLAEQYAIFRGILLHPQDDAPAAAADAPVDPPVDNSPPPAPPAAQVVTPAPAPPADSAPVVEALVVTPTPAAAEPTAPVAAAPVTTSTPPAPAAEPTPAAVPVAAPVVAAAPAPQPAPVAAGVDPF